MEQLDLTDALRYISPAALDYQGWLAVGMALKDSGYGVDIWDDWSRNDSRYHPGECARKWRGFHGSSEPVTAGTIVHMAQENGWKPKQREIEARELAWDAVIGSNDDRREGLRKPKTSGVQQLITYLETLFEASENVGYVMGSWKKDDRYLPNRGAYDRSAGQLIEILSKSGGDIGVLGDYNPLAGAWIRFNPLDGNGVKNENVTDFRYALVESDSMPLEDQRAMIEELRLPVACLVYSGGKSIHAIVRVEAANAEEYRKRVSYLYEICRSKGMEIDRQNSNPSRLSRMPGVMRNGKEQTLLGVNMGLRSWAEWYDYMEAINDDLPDIECFASVWGNLPALSPPLIHGVLRQGHKMLLAGPSKAGKSFSLIELCVAIAEGLTWLGFQCEQGRVLYVNLELDSASCLHRIDDVYRAMKITPQHPNDLDVWNLRGKSVPMDSLAPKLIRRAAKRNYLAIVIDPIYKVITGDENSADQMARFCNQFDKVCTELGCAVIYCHHHSKGAQGGKRSMDRASGSGVFARDPDAMLDLIELEISDDLRKQIAGGAVGKLCGQWLDKHGLLSEVPQDDLCTEKAALAACKELLPKSAYRELERAAEAVRDAAEKRTAWRIEGTLREFPKFPPVNIWFDYPIHQVDDSGVLADIQPEAEAAPWQRGVKQIQKNKKNRKVNRRKALEAAIENGGFDDVPTVSEVAEYLGISERTTRDWIKEHGGYTFEDGKIYQNETGKP